MNILIEKLKEQTQSLKQQYLSMTEEWAEKEYHKLKQWKKEYEEGKYGYGAASKKYYSLPSQITNPRSTVNEYINVMVKRAELHYENSINKLAYRLMSKNMDIDNLKMETSHIGVNIETVLSDGKQTVRAYTVIAGGAVQRPHYRYLIK